MRPMTWKKGLLSVALGGMMIWTACSTAWVGEAEQVVTVLIPGLANLMTLVAALQGKSVSAEDLEAVQNTGTQATSDLRLIESLIAKYRTADAAEQPGLLSQIQVAVKTLESNLNGLLLSLHIKDAATQAKVTAIVALLLSEVQTVAAIVPATDGSGGPTVTVSGRERARLKAPLTAETFVRLYNATITAKTGEDELDRATARLRVQFHGRLARWATAGLE